MSGAIDCDVLVIGAGVVGLSIALRLATEGRAVTIMAPADMGDGASYGNAGVIADHAVLPVGTPETLRSLPALLLGRNAPVALARAALPALAPWLARFAWQSRQGAARRNAQALAALLAEAAGAWRDLATEIGAADLLVQRGALSLFETAAQRDAAAPNLDWRCDLGVKVEMLRAEEVAQLEPAVAAAAQGGGAFFPDVLSITGPDAMLRCLSAVLQRAGVLRLIQRAKSLRIDGASVRVQGEATVVRCRCAIVAAGAWSRPLALAAGSRVPLDTERGYHLEFDSKASLVSRPVTPATRGIYLCPMPGRLRAAGTVELGGLGGAPAPNRLERLEDSVRAILPGLPPPDRSWMGFRPSVPDSVPVIGPARAGPQVLLAFGHGHLGALTLAAITSRMVADMAMGRRPGLDPAPYAPGRF